MKIGAVVHRLSGSRRLTAGNAAEVYSVPWKTVLERLLIGIEKALSSGSIQDVRANVEAVIRANLEKLDLVSREQFDIQMKILERTRKRVNTLEEQVKSLEKRLLDKDADD